MNSFGRYLISVKKYWWGEYATYRLVLGVFPTENNVLKWHTWAVYTPRHSISDIALAVIDLNYFYNPGIKIP